MRLNWYIPLGLVSIALFYAGFQQWQHQQWRSWIGQKLMIDLRSFCPEPLSQPTSSCTTPVTALSEQLAALLHQHQIGGVVLFAQNIQSEPQLRQLTTELQASTDTALPMWIAVDQEGGRISRFPDTMAAAFPGNMALGASYAKRSTELAYATGQAQARQLSTFGINLNFAPTVDVNSNPLNPVINVRAFSDQPQMVAELGIAIANGLQQGGVLATFKHFPGHGDTAVDSHTGLPKVEHNKQQAYAQDIAPFAQAIKSGVAQAVMTAHIQYPSLDSSEVMNAKGEKMLRPATVSKTILTNLLRTELGFAGVVFTDALNMAAIADFFSPEQAVIETFAAGADVALMPLAIRSPADFARLELMIDQVLQAMDDGRLSAEAMEQSYQRIVSLKQKLKLPDGAQQPTDDLQRRQQERALDLEIAHAAVTVVKGQEHLPLLGVKQSGTIWLAMPDAEKCQQLVSAFALIEFSSDAIQCLGPNTTSNEATAFKLDDILIGGLITPQQSAAEFGVIADMIAAGLSPATESEQIAWLGSVMAQAKAAGSRTVLIALRSPYALPALTSVSDIQLVSYGYSVRTDQTAEPGAVYQALAAVLSGKIVAQGQLPVQLPVQVTEAKKEIPHD